MKLAEKKVCSGCTACASSCPKEAITLVADREGFLFPEIDTSQCIECGNCVRTCYLCNEQSIHGNKTPMECYAAKTNDKSLQLSSSSGGMFGELAKSILKQNGVVYGAAFTDSYDVAHIRVDAPEQLPKLYGSKYVQSGIQGVFDSVKLDLEKQKKVLFSGTPCQIAGLKQFLGRKYDYLITVDFICHGVPSPLLWKTYLEEIHHGNFAAIEGISFRDKTFGWKNFSLRISLSNGSSILGNTVTNPYLYAFISDVCLRPSCYQCKIKKDGYYSDITLGDFWAVKKLLPEFYDEAGVSVVLIRTTAGKEFFDGLTEIEKRTCSVQDVQSFNPSLIRQTPRPTIRNRFLQDLPKYGFSKTYSRWLGSTLTAKIRRKICNETVKQRN